VHVPVLTSVTVTPKMVQIGGVVDVRVTGSPEEAVALAANGELPKGRFESVPIVMVWLA
jgi:hypothetical protein